MFKKKKKDVSPTGEKNLSRQDTQELAEGEAGGSAPLLAHLLALRKVLFISALSVVIAFSWFTIWRSII